MKLFKRRFYESILGLKPDTVEDYQQLIQRSLEEIGRLKKECFHQKTKLGFYSYRVGAMIPSKICVDCGQRTGDTTHEESEKLWKDFYGLH